VLATACCAAVAATAGAGTPPQLYALKVGDRFDLRGTTIACTIVDGPAITCGPGSSGSYSFVFRDRGVDVLGPGSSRHVVYQASTDNGAPLGDPAPAGSGKARAVHLRPVAQGLEGATIAKSSIVCLAVSYPKPAGPSLNCTLSSAAITKALGKKRLTFRPLTVTLNAHVLRVWRMSKAKTQRVVFARSEPKS
jgi:hypothetical protein